MRHRRIEILILVFTLLLITTVVYIGAATFSNLKKIESQSRKISKPNAILLNLRFLTAELRNAEGSVRAYSLSKNAYYLSAYQQSLEKIDNCFDSLYKFNAGNKREILLLDSADVLVERKARALNEQLSLRNEKIVVEELNKISSQIDFISKQAPKPKNEDTKVPEKKKGFLSRLFGSKKEEPATIDSSLLVENKVQLKKMKNVVRLVKLDQIRELELMKKKELSLMQKEKDITLLLDKLLKSMQNRQMNQLEIIAKENIRQTAKTNKLTKTFGVLVLVMLLCLFSFSVYYFYRGRKYRLKLKEAAEEATRLAKTRENFLANMSHEMRTPLNAIIGFTGQLLKTDLKEEQISQLGIVQNSSDHLLRLVNNLLDKARIDAGKIVVEKNNFKPPLIINEALALVEVSAKTKELYLKSDLKNLQGQTMYGDSFLLKQILINLLSNAVKFTDKGGVSLEVICEKYQKGKIEMSFAIKDSGVGIPKDKLTLLFNEFEQVDAPTGRKYGGTGLGLWITKKLVEIQGGTIEISSKMGKDLPSGETGTTVLVKLPYEIGEEKEQEEVRQQKDLYSSFAGKKVLVIDDELFNRKLLNAILKNYGFLLVDAVDGKEAKQLLDTQQFDLVLLDIFLPDMDGTELASYIRKQLKRSAEELPIIALTADLTERKRMEHKNKGINESIQKPFLEEDIMNAISKFVGNEKV
ncbi:MAG: ATP-binding protein [Bacteroidota bacterium]|nr:ATP-binding protein [Bacteroidota bacterium]